ncbi:hypothetical protein QTJ16_004867 [Diplocarpon rosae]|uniref:Transcription initiation factor TFIID subunit 2 n=1 Tax=Diplocarpon rosae TaxID=946125 RepID=A0AAD9SXN0_9HELO|nr:hypothetical protein QTJ16_004867 [Diplocarpon rosae]PBP21020.1 TATA-binding protein associated factor Taf2 [Diplocarpon rosae]
MDAPALPAGAPKPEPEYGFDVIHQTVVLDIDFPTQSLTGHCDILILPRNDHLEEIRFDARQCTIEQGGITVQDQKAEFVYEDPMKAMDIPESRIWGVHQADMQKDRLKPMTEDMRSQGPLAITIPPGIRTEEEYIPERVASPLLLRAAGAPLSRIASVALDGTPSATPKTAFETPTKFQPLTVAIDFSIKNFRDGLHFVGLAESDQRFPHVYTKHSVNAGTASCIFPCVDDSNMRCNWEISIKCSRTLGDALKRHPAPLPPGHKHNTVQRALTNGVTEENDLALSDDEKLMEMVVLCSGELTKEIADLEDSSKKIVTFTSSNILAPQHIGFAIGPFEQVDLSQFREVEDDEKLGQGQTVPIWAYCLPGRADEVRHTCAPLTHALDFIHMKFGGYPFAELRFVFIDDQISDTEHTASLSICSNRLLFAEGIIDPEFDSIRTLVHAIASQWFGVGIVPLQRTDRWITVGLSHFITGLFMKSLCGNNDYAFRQKTLSDRLVELDFQRPCIHALGEYLGLGSFEHEFLKLKAPLVMFILDKRIVKSSGSAGLVRTIGKIIVAANTLAETTISTEGFRKTCEKITKYRQTDSFWKEWVYGSGCPRFTIMQKFNKKRLMVELQIIQKQDTLPTQRALQKQSFLREIKEEVHQVWANELQPVFTGPMTIRIHEADGTPYEHIIEIRDGHAKIDIPYNTKYKRLKRNRKQKEQQNATANADPNAEGGEDTLIYCLGDTIQGQDMMDEWDLIEWDAENLAKMETESYEWIRVDADFEWLCEKQFTAMPAYMYVSQLQQDRDVVAQQDSMLYLKNMPAHKLVATFLTRTLMDTRYFHGIRAMAAESLHVHAHPGSSWAGMKQLEKAYAEFYCYPGTKTPRPNDFTDKRAYKIEISVIQSISKIRDSRGNCPKQSRSLLMDILRFNENSNNQYSDNFKIATLLSALAESLIPVKDASNVLDMDEDNGDDMEPMEFQKAVLEELDRYRRMDEWINSYQNIFTVTVLDCKQRLMKAKVIPLDPVEFVQYLHDGTSDFVRIKAFRALIDLGYLSNNSVASLLLNVASTDPSPHTRRELFEIFCLGMAAIAFGENSTPESEPAASSAEAVELDVLMGDAGVEGGTADDILIDASAAAKARAALIARTKSIEGALLALRNELQDNEVLKVALWKAVRSPSIGVTEQLDFLDICHVIYAAVETLVLKLKLPRYWKATHAGRVCNTCSRYNSYNTNITKGILNFKKTNKVRTKPLKAAPKATVVVQPPKTESGPTNSTSQASTKILKFTNVNKLSASSLTATVPPAYPTPASVPTNGARSVAPADGLMKPPSKPLPQKRSLPESGHSSDDRPRKRFKIVKMKVDPDTFSKVLKIQSLPPNPAPLRAQSSTKKSASPAPRFSPAPNKSSPRPSPAPKASPAPRTMLPPGPSAPARTMLPAAPARNPLPPGPQNTKKIKLSHNPGVSRHKLPPTPSTNPSISPVPTATPPSNQTSKSSGPRKLIIANRKPLPGAVPKSEVAPAPRKTLVVKFNVKNRTAERQ